MDKPDIIKKISKIAGIKEHSANQFFETLLRKLVKRLNPGEAAQIEELGFFHYRRNSNLSAIPGAFSETGQENVFDEIVFTPTENSAIYDQIIFDIPESGIPDEHPVDAHFSLSLDKPLLPFNLDNFSDFIPPPSGIELQRLLDSKADKIISGIRIIKSNLDSELFTEPISDNQEVEDLWESLITEFESLKDSSGTIKTETKDKPDASISEDEIKNPEEVMQQKDSNEEVQEDDELFPSLQIEFENSEEKKDIRFNGSEKLEEVSQTEEDDFVPYSETTDLINEHDKLPAISPDGKFQIVESLLHSEKVHLTELKKDQTEDKKKSESAPESARLSIVRTDSNGYVEVQRASEIPGSPAINSFGDKKSNTLKEKPIKKKPYERKSIALPVTIALVLLVILIVIIFQFVKTAEKRDVYTSGSDSKLFSPDVNVIERNDAVPVTYPYDKNDIRLDNSFDPFSSSVNETLTGTEVISEDNFILTDKQKINREQIISNIYKYDDYYVVQIAAFRDKNIAENEVQKLKKNGFDAFIERADIPGKGIWFRVRVRGFKSLNDAKNFRNQKLN